MCLRVLWWRAAAFGQLFDAPLFEVMPVVVFARGLVERKHIHQKQVLVALNEGKATGPDVFASSGCSGALD